MAKAYLGLGSNLGNKKEYMARAVELLAQHSQINVIRKSSYYKTEPVGYIEQDWFLNLVVEIETGLEPYALLNYCNHIEQQLQRERIIRWGPRTIDIDILLYENFISNDKKLTVPHERMTERAFVMVPLLEIAPDLEIDGQPIKDIVESLQGQNIVKLKE